MGRGFGLVCRKCRYEFGIHLGVGFGFPQNYQNIMEAAKAGKLGREVRYFLRENPDGTLDCSQVLLQCTACDSLERGIDLSMFIPKDQPYVTKGNWSVAFPMEEFSYVAPSDLKSHYRLVKHYDHRCKQCKGRMRVITENHLTFRKPVSGEESALVNVNCPKCHVPMAVGSTLMWD